jgi:hypothetical protein
LRTKEGKKENLNKDNLSKQNYELINNDENNTNNLGVAREKSAKVIKVRINSLSPSLFSFLMILHSS